MSALPRAAREATQLRMTELNRKSNLISNEANGVSYSNFQSEFDPFCELFLCPTLSARYVELVVVVHVAASDASQTAPPVEKWAELQKSPLTYF